MTPRQQRFVAEYLKCTNATKAAIRAGYSRKTAGSQGHDLLKNPEIAEVLARKGSEAMSGAVASAQEVLEFWTGVVRDRGEETKERVKASEHLGKYHKLLTDRLEQSGEVVVKFVGAYAPPEGEGGDDGA